MKRPDAGIGASIDATGGALVIGASTLVPRDEPDEQLAASQMADTALPAGKPRRPDGFHCQPRT